MEDYTYLQHDLPITTPAARIVSLIPSMTESLFDLNLGHRVVGITESCSRPEDRVGALARVGEPGNLDIDAIRALEPDLVIANEEINRAEDIDILRAGGMTVWVTFPKTVSDVFVMLWNIMDGFGETSMVPRIRLIEQTLDYVQTIAEQREDDPCRVFVPLSKSPLTTLNADTYIHDLLRACGGYNVFADRTERYPTITLDDVIATQPHVVLLPGEPYGFAESDKMTYAELDIPAAQSNMIHVVDGTLLSWQGTRLAYSLNDIPPLLCEGL